MKIRPAAIGLICLPILFSADSRVASRNRSVVPADPQPTASDPLPSLSLPSTAVSVQTRGTLLGKIPAAMRPPIERLLSKGFRPCDTKDKLPENCFATIAYILGADNFDPLANDPQIEAMLSQAGYRLKQEFSPFKTFSDKSERFIRGFNPDLLSLLDNLAAGDVLLFGNRTGGSRHYLHGAVYLGMLDDRDYIFQARNLHCGPSSHYEIINLEDYLFFFGSGILVTSYIPQTVFVFRP